jgi:glutathione S-transferase
MCPKNLLAKTHPSLARAQCPGRTTAAARAMVCLYFVPFRKKILDAVYFVQYSTKIISGNVIMNLYFAPLACSLASRIAFYEAGAVAQYTRVDTKAKRNEDGSDFLSITPMGQVPALRTDDGTVLTENTAVLQYIADHFPDANLAPPAGLQRAKLQQWLGFIGTELHKTVFIPLLDAKAPAEVKVYAREKVTLRFGILQNHLTDSEFLLDRFTIADAYLTTVLNWARFTGIDLAQWPAVAHYYQKMKLRPSVAIAISEEWALYQKEQAHQPKS